MNKPIARIIPNIRSKPNVKLIKEKTNNYTNIKKVNEFKELLKRGRDIISKSNETDNYLLWFQWFNCYRCLCDRMIRN